MADFTLADFKEATPAPKAEFVAAPDEAPDIIKHDPNTFAALTGQQALKTYYAQGLLPNADEIKAIETKARDTAIDYHKTLAQQQEQANLELQKRAAAVTPTVTKEGVQIPSLATQEERTKAAVELQKTEAQQQWAQGPSAFAAAAAQPGGVSAGQIVKMTDEESNKMASYIEGGHNLQNLHNLFDSMVTNTGLGAGGVLKSVFGAAAPIGQMTSPQARIYHAYAESSVIPLAKGLMGDAATTAGRPDVSAKMLDAMPNPEDNAQSGGAKVYMMLDRNINNLQTERDMMRKRGVDTSPIDSQILDLQTFFKSPSVQKYNPLTNQVVQVGVSDQANATVTNTNAGANAGVQVQPAPTANQSGSTLAPQPQQQVAAPQPAAASPTPPLTPEHQRILSKVTAAPGQAAQWFQNLFPENWNPQVFQK